MTREVPLTQGFVALVDDADFEAVSVFRWYARSPDGVSTVYARRRRLIGETGPKTILLHRFILGTSPGVIVDHINGDGLDCRRINLRECDVRGNAHNRRPIRGAPFKGVSRDGRGKFFARISLDYTPVHLGTFTTEVEAAVAYDAAARRLFGEFAYLNFPSLGDTANVT